MKTKKLVGLTGSIVLFFGVFTPIVGLPFGQTLNYFRDGSGEGTIVLILALISLVLVLAKKYKGLWVTGIGSFGTILFTLIHIQSTISQFKSEMTSELPGNPFLGLANRMMQSIHLEWGWVFLILGAVLVIASAAIKDERQ